MKNRLRLFGIALLASASLLGQGSAAATKKTTPVAGESSHAKLIDINTASAEELKIVPGIGDAYAAKIIAGRPYRAKDDLVEKKVLPSGVYSKVKDRLIAKQKK
ncbi:MAG: helix-hairpin-helix domain-containing protein [Bryobacteraceae bacterium]|nr:helix-hairpin-helix domain-containing protein [Bryobacteraceae bacterium]